MKCINQLKMLQKGSEHMNTHRQNLCMAARLMRQVYCNIVITRSMMKR